MTMESPDKYQALEQVDIFSGLPAADRRIIADCAVVKVFRKNTVLVNAGDRAESLYIILSGAVRVFVSDEDGREVTLNVLGPGEYFGEIALVDEGPRSASVITMEPSRITLISKGEFERCMSQYPPIALNLIRALARRVRALTENVKGLALLDVYGRVARTLLDLAAEHEGRLVIAQRLTHQDIANIVGSSREMVSRIMKDLTTGGYITVKDKKIVINDRLPARW